MLFASGINGIFTWSLRKNHEKDFVVKRCQGGLKDKVAGAAGIEIFHQKLPRVSRLSYAEKLLELWFSSDKYNNAIFELVNFRMFWY